MNTVVKAFLDHLRVHLAHRSAFFHPGCVPASPGTRQVVDVPCTRTLAKSFIWFFSKRFCSSCCSDWLSLVGDECVSGRMRCTQSKDVKQQDLRVHFVYFNKRAPGNSQSVLQAISQIDLSCARSIYIRVLE